MMRGKELLPPPNLPRSDNNANKTPPPLPDRAKTPRGPALPPPLPARKNTSGSQNQNEAPPPLPRRNAPDLRSRKSEDSTGSLSTLSTETSRSSGSGMNPLRAPAWGETELPQLPPRRETDEKRKKNNYNNNTTTTTTTTSTSTSRRQPPRSPPSGDEARRSSAVSLPKLPLRSNTREVKAPPPVPTRTPSGESLQQRKAPPPPARPAVLQKLQANSLSSLNKLNEEGNQQPDNKCNDQSIPPPLPNGATNGHPTPPPRPSVPKKMPSSLEAMNNKLGEKKEQQLDNKWNGRSVLPLPNGTSDHPTSPPRPPRPSVPKRAIPSLESMNKLREEKVPGLTNGVDDGPSGEKQPSPPPIPIASRPDLSKLQATKPRVSPPISPGRNVTSVSAGVPCLKCRDFSGPDAHAAQYPRQSLPTQDLGWLARELTAPFPSATDKARAIFTWLHHNIVYDVVSFFNNNVKPSTPESTLSSGLAVCDGYAGLFERLATNSGLEARKISGHGAGYGHDPWVPGSPLPPFKSTHAWNAVRIDDGLWKLVDPCWGAGHICTGKYNQKFSPEQFTMSNDDFGKRHYPTDATHFYRDDGRPSISWEEYVRNDPKRPGGVEPATLFSDMAEEHGIGEHTLQPAGKQLSINQPGPIRFQFGLICDHWTLQGHSHKSAPFLFVLATHGVDGRKDELVPFTYVPGGGGGGDVWYLDVADPRTLGAPGQRLMIYTLTKFGDREGERARGLTVREFREKYGRVGWASKAVTEWTLV